MFAFTWLYGKRASPRNCISTRRGATASEWGQRIPNWRSRWAPGRVGCMIGCSSGSALDPVGTFWRTFENGVCPEEAFGSSGHITSRSFGRGQVFPFADVRRQRCRLSLAGRRDLGTAGWTGRDLIPARTIPHFQLAAAATATEHAVERAQEVAAASAAATTGRNRIRRSSSRSRNHRTSCGGGGSGGGGGGSRS